MAGKGDDTEVERDDRRRRALGSLRVGATELLRLGHVGCLHVVEPLCIHVPDLGVTARCLVAAAHRAVPQIALFDSFEDYIAFAHRSHAHLGLSLDLGIPLLALTFHEVSEAAPTPGPAVEAEHADVIPRVTRVHRDGRASCADASELMVMAACCRGLAAFVRRNRDRGSEPREVRSVTLTSAPVVHVDVYRTRASRARLC